MDAPTETPDSRMTPQARSMQRLVRRPSHERKHIETLKRRLDHLAVRAASNNHKPDHDRREMAALLWALGEIEK